MRADFDRLWPLLAEAIARYGPTHDKEHIWQAIEAGQAQFWPGAHSAMVTEVKAYPTGFQEIIGWLAAGKLEEIEVMMGFAEAAAKANGCHRVNLTCREGFKRPFGKKGYRQIMVVLVKDL